MIFRDGLRRKPCDRVPLHMPHASSSIPAHISNHGGAKFLHRVLEPRVLGPVIGALAVALALFAIHALHGRIHLAEVRTAIAATPWAHIALALAFTGASFLALAGYDVIAARRVAPEKVSTRLAALAGFIAYGFSNALGFHVFIGGPLRYRIYQSAGVDAADVGRITGISVLTTWLDRYAAGAAANDCSGREGIAAQAAPANHCDGRRARLDKAGCCCFGSTGLAAAELNGSEVTP